MTITNGDIAGLFCALVWALNGLILRTQSTKVPPALLNTIRCSVAAVFFWVLIPFDSGGLDFSEVTTREWLLLVSAMFIGIVVGDLLYLVSIREIGVSRTLALVGVYPLTTLLFEQLLLDVPLKPSFAFGSVLVASGVVCLSSRVNVDAESGRVRLGVVVAIVAAFLWGLSTVLLAPAIVHMTPIQANAIRMPAVAVVFYFLWRLTRGPSRTGLMDRRTLMIVGLTGLLGMGIASIFYLYAIQQVGAAKTATLSAATPVFGLVMAVVFLKEKVTVRLALGVALCVGGVLLVLG